MPTELLPVGTAAAESAPVVIADNDTVTFAISGGAIFSPGQIVLQYEHPATKWNDLALLTSPANRFVTIPGPCTVRAVRTAQVDDYLNKGVGAVRF